MYIKLFNNVTRRHRQQHITRIYTFQGRTLFPMQYGETISRAFVSRLDQLGMLRRDLSSATPEDLAVGLGDITDFIFRGFRNAELINSGEHFNPVNDLLDGNSELDDPNYQYGYFGAVKNKARSNGKGRYRATDVI